MEEPQRSIALKNYEMISTGWEAMLARTRENIQAGSDFLDVLAAEGMFLYSAEGQTSENLAFTVAAIAVYEAQRSPRSRGARKAAVPAKRRKIAAKVTDIPGSQALSDYAEQKILEAEAQEAQEGKETGPIEHGPHPLEAEDE